jgi:hypothetical protein
MDFSVILQSPEVRSVVQENLLEKAFHDALYPKNLFRSEATPVAWPAGVGDTQIFSAPGLMPIDAQPLTPGQDPIPDTYPVEQWTAKLQQYARSTDTHMPTSYTAIANLFLRNAHQLGLQAAQTLNRIVRNRMYNSALSGWTVADGAQSGTTLRVKRLNGLTRARNPDITGASTVRFDLVSSTNPLSVRIFDNGAEATFNVIGFTPDTPGDEVGPGTVTLSAATTSVADRGYIVAADATGLVRVGGGEKVDDIGSSDIPTLADVRTAVADFWQQNVPEHPDGRFHCHIDPVSQALVYADPELQRLMTSLPDYYVYRQFALGEMLGTVFFRNSECPVSETVIGGPQAQFDQRDPFAGELFNDGTTSGVKIHRMLFSAQGGIMEYHADLNALITDAGVTGQVGDPRIVNNGIEVNSERIQLIIRAPLNRLQDSVSTSWKFIGDWPVRTDAAVGSASRYKRFKVIEHGE